MYHICLDPNGTPQVKTLRESEIDSIYAAQQDCGMAYSWGTMQLKGWVCQRVDLVKA